MNNIANRLEEIGIVPVVSIPKREHALPLGESLLAGGLPCAEITFRTASAADAIRDIRRGFPDLLVGAGTVLTTEQGQRALDAGAQFLVSPGTNPAVVAFARERNVPIFPGVCTPTEIESALAMGLEVLKFFPAEPMGGVPFLKAVCAPYRSVRFIPTGGIGPTNLGAYLALPQVVACGGSWMVKPDLFEAGDWATVTQLAADAVALVNAHRAQR